MSEITPEVLEKLKAKNLSNLVKKLKDGKTLTASEHKLIEGYSGKSYSKPKSSSQESIAAWLCDVLGLEVTRQCVRGLKAKGVNLTNPDEVLKALRNQERMPKSINTDESKEPDEDDDFPDITAEQIPAEIAKLESQLIKAIDYESARTISTKLTGLKNAFRLHVEMGQYVTKESQERDGMRAGLIIKQLILKIDQLPDALQGLNYPDMKEKCQEFSHSMLMEISNIEGLQA